MTALKPGDKAPEFTSTDQNGKEVSLKDFAGKKVVLYFYPKDNTPGCTAEACDFRDNYQSLKAKGFDILGVSTDDEKSHKKFEEKFDLPFTLLADTNQDIVNKYGVWIEKNMYGKAYMGTNRKTFVIDEEGNIQTIIEKVDTKNASQQLLESIK